MFASTGAVQTGAGHQLVLLVIAEPFVRGAAGYRIGTIAQSAA